MATLTIRQLDDATKEALRVRAAHAGRSMEEEARTILAEAVRRNASTGAELYREARRLFGEGEGVDLRLPKRGLEERRRPDFSGPEYDPPIRPRRKK